MNINSKKPVSVSWAFQRKPVLGKGAPATGRTAALGRLSSPINSKIWGRFPRTGLRLESVHQEPPHRQIPDMGYKCRIVQATYKPETTSEVSYLGYRENAFEPAAQWAKVLFSDESKFCI
ncbi:hypothetical protein AMECASPLE_038166 [Ameca splendens]|uniref:Uncharacterized protein n=1 Tax=Ameca splendens TaxID=208324 RepID=A0ABV0XL52_9TELE